MKNKKIIIIYRDLNKLLSFKNVGNPASSQPNFKATTRLFKKKFIKPNLYPLKFRITVILCKNIVKLGRREQFKFKIGLMFASELEKGYFSNDILRSEFYTISGKK